MAATTPRPLMPPPPTYPAPSMNDDTSHIPTPTRDTFGGLPGQRPLPNNTAATTYLGRTDSAHSTRTADSYDVDMEDAQQASDNDSAEGDLERTGSKKKKSQRFFCTDFPPCSLSFTRSEHLNRHIRKHTGERPFQCHCGKRFTRLDNLRQHAQTVHVNEDIPGDSLAATGARFQRQIRTERIRPPNRSRGSIGGGPGQGHVRGHSRNWSESSIGSVSDVVSPMDDGRRRAPYPVMTQMSPARGSLSVDTSIAGQAETYRTYYNDSPGAYGSPTSAFSYGPSSPSQLTSPGSVVPRGPSWNEGSDAASRRLTFSSSQGQMPPPYLPGSHYASSYSQNGSGFVQSGSGFASPTASVFSDELRDFSNDPRRRTWHPGTQYASRPATSGLSYYQTPDDHGPKTAGQPAASQAIRLPGIEAFDRASLRAPAPGDINANRHSAYELLSRAPEPGRHDQRGSWGSISSGMTQMELSRSQDESQQSRMRRPSAASPPLLPVPTFQHPCAPHRGAPAAPPSSFHAQPRAHMVDVARGQINEHPRPHTIDNPMTPRDKKRLGWYHGPPPVASEPFGLSAEPSRTSPVSSSSGEGLITPSITNAIEYGPAIIHNGRYVEHHRAGLTAEDALKTPPPSHTVYASPAIAPAHPYGAPTYLQPTNSQPTDTNRLDALVAAATGDQQATERH